MRTAERLLHVLQDPVFVIGGFLSFLVPLVAFLVGFDGEFAIIVGLLLLILTMLMQVIAADRVHVSRHTLYGKIVEAIESSSWLAPEVRKILAHMAGAEKRFRDFPISAACRSVFREVAADVERLAEGRISVNHRRVEIAACKELRQRLRALTVETESSWSNFWSSPPGQAYVDAQKRAVHSKEVTVQRIFVYDNWFHELSHVAQEQQRAGIEVFRVHVDKLTNSPELMMSFCVYDDICGGESISNSEGESVSHKFTVVEHEVAEMIDRFELALGMSEKVPEAA